MPALIPTTTTVPGFPGTGELGRGSEWEPAPERS